MPAAAPKPAVPDDLQKDLHEWSKLAAAATAAIEAERKFRAELVAKLLPTTKEGKSTFLLPHDWKLEIDQKFNRTLDQQALPTAIQQMRDLNITQLGITVESLFKYTADIVITPMREIEKAVAKEKDADGPAHKIYAVLASVMTTKPGLPGMKIVPPTKAE